MTLQTAIKILRLYQYGGTDDGTATGYAGMPMAPHSFDLNNETVDAILSALEQPEIESNIYDTEEVHENCTVQILRFISGWRTNMKYAFFSTEVA